MKKLLKRLKRLRNINFDEDSTPKLHLLEVYVPMALRLHKCLRLFAEEPMEREHQNNNKLQYFVSERQKLDWAPKKNLGTKRSYWCSRSTIGNPGNDFIDKAGPLLCEKDKI